MIMSTGYSFSPLDDIIFNLGQQFGVCAPVFYSQIKFA